METYFLKFEWNLLFKMRSFLIVDFDTSLIKLCKSGIFYAYKPTKAASVV